MICISKVIHKTKHPYVRRFTSSTYAYVELPDKDFVKKIQCSIYGNFKKTVEVIKNRYPDTEIKINDKPYVIMMP